MSDRCDRVWGFQGRVGWLFAALLGEGICLMLFSQAGILPLAIGLMLITGLFVKMSNGATYAIVPFINRPALGMVAGLVGAGGNVGAVLAGICFGAPELWPATLLLIGVFVCGVAFAALSLQLKPLTTAGSHAPQVRRESAIAGAMSAALAE